jgi:hypothetical protein
MSSAGLPEGYLEYKTPDGKPYEFFFAFAPAELAWY